MNPSMFPDEVAFLTSYLNKSTSYLEYGCDGTTFLAVRTSPALNRIVSVEANQYKIHQFLTFPEILQAAQANRLEFRHDTHVIGGAGAPYSIPATEQYDLILVDGWFRVYHTLMLVNQLTDNTVLLVHDYTNRPMYHILESFYDITETVGTLVRLRPKASINQAALAAQIDIYKTDPR
jgi:hypothetical protein